MKIKIGAIIEIPTAQGLAYAQYTNKHQDFGYLIHVIKGFYTETPHDLESLACRPYTIRTFFPLGAAVRRKIFKIVGHAHVPEYVQKVTDYPNRSIWNDTLLIERIEQGWTNCDDEMGLHDGMCQK